MNENTVIVGLTGQTGAGKSTVSAYFEQNGYAVIDADQIAREVVEPGSDCLKKLAGAFGSGIVDPIGALDRKKLADIVFHSQKQLDLLNRTIFPYITARIQDRIQEFTRQGRPYILLDAPTLFEAGADSLCDYIVSVVAPEPLRLHRICQRDKLTQEQAAARISAQHEETFYRKRSSYVIENYGDLSALAEQAGAIASMIIEAAEGSREATADSDC